jgi:hypothetical protein
MNERTVTNASRRGTRTVPIPNRPKRIRHDRPITLSAEELALAMEIARHERTEQQIRDYTHRKRTA